MSLLTEIDCETAKEFLDLITPWSTPYKLSNYVFRGHTDANYNLHPNILRKKKQSRVNENRQDLLEKREIP